MSNDELQKAIDDITRDNAMPVAPAPEAGAAENEALANELAGAMPGAPTKGEGVALNPVTDLGAAPAPTVPEVPSMPPAETQAESEAPAGMKENEAAAEVEAPVAVQTTPEAEIAPVEAFSQEQADKLTIGESKMEKVEASGDDLEKIEKAAMKELYPLLEKVSLSAEEKFEICMEVAGEEPRAIAGAFEAAKRIQDEKVKAEALLRIVKFKK